MFDVNRDEAMRTLERIRDHGGRANFIEVDVSNEDEVGAGLETAASEAGPIHGLVNNAGVFRSVRIVEATADDWDYHFDVNARGTFFCSKHVARQMIENGVDGAIVNIASAAVERPLKSNGAYAASKGAIAAFTRVLAKEPPDTVFVAGVVPPDRQIDGHRSRPKWGRGEIKPGALSMLRARNTANRTTDVSERYREFPPGV